MNLYNAPFEQLLMITMILDEELNHDLRRAGLGPGEECHKHLTGAPPSLRVKGPSGSVVLGSGMAEKVMVKCGGSVKPLNDILFEDDAVIDNLKGGKGFQNALGKLGLTIGSNVRLLRRLPPMEYVLRLDNRRRIKISETLAARILGSHEDGRVIQLSAARVEMDFNVVDIAAGRKVASFLKDLGVTKNDILVLEGVEHSKDVFYQAGDESGICVKSRHGASRIYLSEDKAKLVEVKTV